MIIVIKHLSLMLSGTSQTDQILKTQGKKFIWYLKYLYQPNKNRCQQYNWLLQVVDNIKIIPTTNTYKINKNHQSLQKLLSKITCRLLKKVKVKVARSYPTLCNPLPFWNSPWNSPGQNTGVGSLSLLREIFPTQESKPGIKPRSSTWQADSLPAEPQGRP